MRILGAAFIAILILASVAVSAPSASQTSVGFLVGETTVLGEVGIRVDGAVSVATPADALAWIGGDAPKQQDFTLLGITGQSRLQGIQSPGIERATRISTEFLGNFSLVVFTVGTFLPRGSQRGAIAIV